MSSVSTQLAIMKANETLVRSKHTGKQAVPDSKEKMFITFPYPYMNGKLHLGHGYTILNAEMQAEYYRLKGKNVLFPFAFHASGMPIKACATKLERELIEYDYCAKIDAGLDVPEFIASLQSNCQIRILLDMDVDKNEISKFADPKYWPQYFSEKAIEDLKLFGTTNDFSRSFITTDMNPHYDSFINWQFTHLISDGYIIQGKRYVIYSILDDQPCADHDRATGEGTKPFFINIRLFMTYYGYIIATKCGTGILCMNVADHFVSFAINGETYISNIKSYNNIKYQYKDVSEPTDFDIAIFTKIGMHFENCNLPYGTGFYDVSNMAHIEKPDGDSKQKTDFCYYEPETTVISRTGDTCIVAYTDQWFINYGHPELKAHVEHYVKTTFTSPTESIQKQIETCVQWLNEWPCSRNFGLGTFIPGTHDLIDSLSDSTIYMAYYTVAHIIKHIPMIYVTLELWDYVFLGKSYTKPIEYIDKIEQMRQEFMYWYPVDIRVSGKDLVNNHLTMALFTHYAIWKDEKYLPRTYIINGYLMLNNEKMSKSTGNFMTLNGAITKYGADITRFTLANNDGLTDGNFNETFAVNSLIKLTNEREWILGTIQTHIKNSNSSTIWDYVFDYSINECMFNADIAYKAGKYVQIINTFNKMISFKNEYIKMCDICKQEINTKMLDKYITNICVLIKPIIPFWVKYIEVTICEYNDTNDAEYNCDFHVWTEYTNDENNKKYSYYRDIINEISNNCNSMIVKQKKKNPLETITLKISIFKSFTDTEQEIIRNPASVDLQTGKNYGLYKSFKTFIDKQISQYPNWLTWISNNNQEEFNIIQTYIPLMLDVPCIIELVAAQDKNKFKVGPSMPYVAKNM